MEETKQTRVILNEFLISDLVNIVIDYTYEKCNKCKENSSKMNVIYNNTFICEECFVRRDYIKCSHCDKFYGKLVSSMCVCCGSSCLVFCPNCVNGLYLLEI